jgi:hypothetical protein
VLLALSPSRPATGDPSSHQYDLPCARIPTIALTPTRHTGHRCPERYPFDIPYPQSATVLLSAPFSKIANANHHSAHNHHLSLQRSCSEAFTFSTACVIASATSQRPRPHIVLCCRRVTTRHLHSIANPSLGSSEKKLRAGRSRHTSPDIPAPTPAGQLAAALPPGILSAHFALPVRL